MLKPGVSAPTAADALGVPRLQVGDYRSGARQRHRTRRAQLNVAATNASADVQREQATLDLAQRELAAAEAVRTTAEQAARQMQQRWNRAGLNGIPSQAEYDRGLVAIDAMLAGLRSLAERQLVLARQNEDALLQA